MKANTVFKALALALLMPAMLLTTACIDNEIPREASNEIFATVKVTCQSSPATKATYNDGTKKIEFSTGDKLFVKGEDKSVGGAGKFAGTLDMESPGTFSGTILTQNPYSGTIDALFTAGSAEATLLPACYGTYGFLTIQNDGTYSASILYYYENTFATSKALAIEQFSDECGAYTSGTGFSLTPDHAILNFTINGLSASTEVAVLFYDGDYSIPGNVTTDGSGTATFAIGVIVEETDLNTCSLTVGGNAITLVNSSRTLAAGHIYNITRSAAPAPATGHALSASVVGEVVGTDGLAYAVVDKDNLPTGVTAAGMVAYKSGSNGLVIALADEASTMNWSTANGTTTGAAAHTPTVTGQTWKLPSQAKWQQMFSANGGNQNSYTGLNTTLAAAGGDSSKLQENDSYWSSTGGGVDLAYFVSLTDGDALFFRVDKGYPFRVRACLAF